MLVEIVFVCQGCRWKLRACYSLMLSPTHHTSIILLQCVCVHVHACVRGRQRGGYVHERAGARVWVHMKGRGCWQKKNTNRSIGGLMRGGLMNYLSLGHTNEDVKTSHLLSISHEIFGRVRNLWPTFWPQSQCVTGIKFGKTTIVFL